MNSLVFRPLERARSLFHYPVASVTGKFMARVTWAGCVGMLLNDDMPFENQAVFSLGLGLFALILSFSFFGFDRKPMDSSRFALYGLYIAGEVLSVSAVVFMALSGFCGVLYAVEILLCVIGGSVFCVFPMAELMRRNTRSSLVEK